MLNDPLPPSSPIVTLQLWHTFHPSKLAQNGSPFEAIDYSSSRPLFRRPEATLENSTRPAKLPSDYSVEAEKPTITTQYPSTSPTGISGPNEHVDQYMAENRGVFPICKCLQLRTIYDSRAHPTSSRFLCNTNMDS